MRRSAFQVMAMLVAACSAPTPTPTLAPPSPSAVAASPVALGTPAPEPPERPTPTPVLSGPCPDLNTLEIYQLMESDPACFPGDVALRGWLDTPPPLGFEGPLVEPQWLYYPADNFASLWSDRPAGEDHLCPEAATNCAWIFLHVAPDSGVVLGRFARWIDVVGHINDPAAPTCHYTYSDDPDENIWGSPSDESLPQACAQNFVVTQAADLAHD